MLQRSEQTRGELIAIAHMVRALNDKLDSYSKSFEPSLHAGVSYAFDLCRYEFERLIGNQFQTRTDIGCPVQLAKVILLMAGEESE